MQNIVRLTGPIYCLDILILGIVQYLIQEMNMAHYSVIVCTSVGPR